MPVRKFRSVEELNQPTWRTPGDPELYRAIAGLWASAARIRPRVLQHGVRRFRSIEELDEATSTWRDAPAPRIPGR